MCKRLRDRIVRPELLTCKESLNERKAIIRYWSLYSESKNITFWRKNQRRCPHTIDRCFHYIWLTLSGLCSWNRIWSSVETSRDCPLREWECIQRLQTHHCIFWNCCVMVILLMIGISVQRILVNLHLVQYQLIPTVFKYHVPCQMTMHFELLWSLL